MRVNVLRPEAVLVTKDSLGLSDGPRRLHVSIVMGHVRRVSELGLSDGPRSWLGPGDLPGPARPASGQQIWEEERL